MTKAPVSCCIITRDDPHLEQAVASVAPYVEQVCILDTGTNAPPGVNDALGRIVDFAAARNASLAMATQPWAFWLDSDDILTGGEHLLELTQRPDTLTLFPYEYAYDQLGRVVVRQYRERLAPRDRVKWVFPVHEVLVPIQPGLAFAQDDRVIVKHRRQYNPKPAEHGRNLRILTAWMADHPDDVRNAFYFGLELNNAGRTDEAVDWLSRYLEKAGWNDEKAMACFTLVKIFESKKQYEHALHVAFKALETVDWFESYFAICRCFYHLKNWERCARYGKLAECSHPTKTPLFVNEADRHELHVYLNVALNQLGKPKAAYESCLAGLEGNPEHVHLRHNRSQYEKHLGIERPRPQLSAVYNPKCLDIVFVTASWEKWDPESIKTTGIGGSETMLAHMSRLLAERGHKVTVYADPQKEGEHDGAMWRDRRKFRDVACDVLVVSRNADYLDEALDVHAKLRLLWCHDVCAVGATPRRLLRADRLLALSAWHKSNLLATHSLQDAHVEVTRNGIDLRRFSASPERNPYRIVNSSSPDRSWPVLLELFPKVRKRVPQAELHLFYGFDNWRKAAYGDQLQTELIDRLVHAVKNTPGVTYHGRVSQERLAEEFLKSGVWAHPTWFTETSCITAMEARAAGLHIVTSNLAALKETAKYGALLDGEWTDAKYQRSFIEACVVKLEATGPADYPIEDIDISTLGVEWESMFLRLLEEKKTTPILPYYPTKPYWSPSEGGSPPSVSGGVSCSFRGHSFQVLKGKLHPQYSLDCFAPDKDETSFREKYFDPKPGEVVFDVGASYGAYTLPALAAGAMVVAFEPEAQIFVDLQRNIDVNGWHSRAFPFNHGLADREGVLDVKPLMPHWPQHTITHPYRMFTLDEAFANQRHVDRMDWLKIDVEGMELAVLRGGLETIKKHRPKLIIECHVFQDGEIPNAVREMLTDYDLEEVPRDPCVMMVGNPKQGRAPEAHRPHKSEVAGSIPAPATKLNIACGPNIFPYDGWINYDKLDFEEYFRHVRTAPLEGMPAHQQELAKWMRGRQNSLVRIHDVTKPFTQHEDGSVDFVYCGQMIEHLNRRTQVVPFLKECHRMLKPGGVLRMTTPDMWTVLHEPDRISAEQPEWFKEACHDEKIAYVMFGASGPDCTQTNYEGHMFIYSRLSLSSVLQDAGFGADRISFESPARPEIRDEGMSHSLCVEATR